MKCLRKAGWILLAAAGFAGQAVSQNISTTGFANCGSNATIKVNYANVGFDQSAGSIGFNVSGTSTEQQNVNVSLTVTVYGVQVYTNRFDPCASATKVDQLCPVHSGTFSANGSQKIPAQFLSQVPSIAFSIPDLDGNVTLKLTGANGTEVGCIQSGVSNGKSLQLPAVSFVAVGVAAAALIVTGFTSAISAGAATTSSCVGFGTVVGWFHTISITGMMSVNFPPVYRSFSQNFAFSTGLIPLAAFQTSIDNFRNSTGGNLTDDSTAFLQNASLVVSDGSNSTGILARSTIYSVMAFLRARDTNASANNNTTPAAGNSSIVQTVYGIGAFAEELMIPQANIFMTALLIFGIVAAAITVGILLFKAILEAWAMCGTLPRKLASFRKRYWSLLAKTLAGLILLVYGIWVAWSIFQFTVGDSFAARVLAAVSLAIFTAVLVAFAARIVIMARRYRKAEGDASALFDNKETWLKYGVFYDAFRRAKWWMFMPLIVFDFARGAILAGGNGHGLAQTIGQLALETVALAFLLWNRPFATPAGNWINLVIQAVRVVSFACVLVFVEELGITQTTKTVTGFVLVVVQAVLAGLLAILIAVNGLILFCRDNPHRKARKDKEKLWGGPRRRDTLTSLDARNSFLARSALLGAIASPPASAGVDAARPSADRAYQPNAPSAVPRRNPAGDGLTLRAPTSYDTLAYRQPTIPMV